MICEIDQSGKVEDTRKLTVVCFANGKAKTLLISAKEKRKALNTIRDIDKPKRTFIFRIFSGLLFLLIKNENLETIVIDEEYPEHEATIKFILLNIIILFQSLIQNFHKYYICIYFLIHKKIFYALKILRGAISDETFS